MSFKSKGADEKETAARKIVWSRAATELQFVASFAGTIYEVDELSAVILLPALPEFISQAKVCLSSGIHFIPQAKQATVCLRSTMPLQLRWLIRTFSIT